jgi:hypothetical protein
MRERMHAALSHVQMLLIVPPTLQQQQSLL